MPLSEADLEEIKSYCDLDLDVIVELADIFGIQSESDFCEVFEGHFTEEELIEKQEEFYSQHGLGTYRSIHNKDRCVIIPDREDENYFYWFNKPEAWPEN